MFLPEKCFNMHRNILTEITKHYTESNTTEQVIKNIRFVTIRIVINCFEQRNILVSIVLLMI